MVWGGVKVCRKVIGWYRWVFFLLVRFGLLIDGNRAVAAKRGKCNFSVFRKITEYVSLVTVSFIFVWF